MSRIARTAALMAALTLIAAGPPPALTENHVVHLFGIRFPDPYHWMEKGGPHFDDWLTQQDAYTRKLLDSVPGRPALLEELRRLNGAETQVSGVVKAGGQWIYSKTRPEDRSPKIFARAVAGGEERLLVDPARFDTDGKLASIDYWTAAPDGRHVAYGISLGGGETGVLHIVDVATATDLSDHMDRTRLARPSWLDGNAFLYPRLQAPGPGEKQQITGARVFLHRLATDPKDDVRVFGPGLVAGELLPKDYFFRGVASPNSPFVIGEFDAGLGNSPKAVFVTRKDGLGPKSVWRQVARFDDDVRGVLPQGDILYVRTAHGVAHQRIVRTPAAHPDLAQAAIVVPEGEGTIAGMVPAADALYVQRNRAGLGQFVRVPWSGQPEILAPPFEGAFIALAGIASEPGAVLRMEGWTRSQTVFAYDPQAKAFSDTGIAAPSPVKFDDIAWTEMQAPAPDGTMVPLSVLAPRDTPRNGNHPLLLYAYGAYGATLEPNFDPTRRAWFDHGGVYAVVHVRGSGGFGEAWHRAGRLETKLNSVTDFIAAARYLVRQGWTSAESLAAMGGSAGGIVIGGAITKEPALFGAAIIEVGLLNMLRLEQIPIGAVNTSEFGSTESEEGVRLLASIDAYLQLRAGVWYPGVLVATKRNDARVSPWMPAKFAAKLQADDAGPRPELLRVEAGGGHGLGTRDQFEQELADYFTFLFWQAGLPDFQPRP